MVVTQHIGEALFGLLFMPWVAAEAIRLLAPRYHARMLRVAKEMAR